MGGAASVVWAEIPQRPQSRRRTVRRSDSSVHPGRLAGTLVIAGIVGVGGGGSSLMPKPASQREVGLERSLIFAALIPTLALTRATARPRMPRVIRRSARIAALSPESGDIERAAAAAVRLSGLRSRRRRAFAIMSAVLPSDASPERRKSAGAAGPPGNEHRDRGGGVLRRSFAVASAALPSDGSVANHAGRCSGDVLHRDRASDVCETSNHRRDQSGRACLMPILPRMAIAAGMVIAASLILGLTTLGAVVVVMPLLCYWQMRRRPENTEDVQAETWAGLSRVGPDLVLIAAAMVLGTVAESSEPVQAMLSSKSSAGNTWSCRSRRADCCDGRTRNRRHPSHRDRNRHDRHARRLAAECLRPRSVRSHARRMGTGW